MYKNLSNNGSCVVFRRFMRKNYAIFCSCGREIRIGVLSVATLTFANVGCFATTCVHSATHYYNAENCDDDDDPLTQTEADLMEGDLLFEIDNSAQANKVTQVTTGADGLKISHVAIVVGISQQFFALEAIGSGVTLTPIKTFIDRQKHCDGQPCAIIARLRNRSHVSLYVHNAMQHIGKPYDVHFLPNNDAWYCSELVYEAFVDDDGRRVFEAHPMTFKDHTGNIAPLWVEHFKRINAEVPEGVMGTNPGDMSKSNNIYFVKFIY